MKQKPENISFQSIAKLQNITYFIFDKEWNLIEQNISDKINNLHVFFENSLISQSFIDLLNNSFFNNTNKNNVELEFYENDIKIYNLDSYNLVTLEASKEQDYKSIFENAVMGIYKSSPGTGKHLFCNPELARIYGYESIDELMKKVTDISHQLYVNPERREELIKSLEDKGETIGFESQLYRKDGSFIWISENAKAVKNHDGEIQFIVGTVKDITNLKLAQEEMRMAKDDWELTFNSIDDIIIILDKELRIRRMNKSAKENMGLFFNDYDGKECFNIFSCDNLNCHKCPAKRTIKDKKSYIEEFESLKQGKSFLSYSSPIIDKNKNLSGVVFIIKDITEEKRLKRESEYRLQQVIQADKLKSLGEMVAGVAHEINNPNSIILTNISLLDESWKELYPIIHQNLSQNYNNQTLTYYSEIINEFDEILKSTKTGSQRIKTIVTNLKEFARINSIGVNKKLDINEVVDKTISIIGAYAKRYVSNFIVDKGENIPHITAHFQNLEQILINFIMNSTQAITDKSKGQITIRTKFIKSSNYVILEIEDNGCGIEDEIQIKILEPFFTTRREQGGTGLGLSISYDMLKQMKGQISLQSKINIGTKICIYLPLNDKEVILKPKIVCVDSNDKNSKKWEVFFSDDKDKFFIRLTEMASLTNYLEDHPEVDTLIINCAIGNYVTEILKKLKLKYPLINILIFNSNFIDTESLKENLNDIIYLHNPDDLNELEQILSKLVRLKI